MISQRIKELIEKAEREKVARQFWNQIEKEAEQFEVTVDYYLAEFYWWRFYLEWDWVLYLQSVQHLYLLLTEIILTKATKTTTIKG